MTAELSVDRLRRIADRAARGEPLGEDGPWLASRLSSFLDGGAADLAATLGLMGKWRTAAAITRRNAAIREMAGRYFSGSTEQKALAIAYAARSYETTAWRFDKNAPEMPNRYAGTPKELLYQAYRAHPRFPLGTRQIRSILEGDNTGE